MAKAKRKAERAERKRLKLLQGGGQGGEVPPPVDSVPLKGRPEYEAHMAAWREAGEPYGPSRRDKSSVT